MQGKLKENYDSLLLASHRDSDGNLAVYLYQAQETCKSQDVALRGIVAALTQNAIYPADIAYALSIAKDAVGHEENGAYVAVVAAEEVRSRLRGVAN